MSEDWDLFAVVKSCSTTTTTSRQNNVNNNMDREVDQTPLSCSASLTFEDEQDYQNPCSFPDLGNRNIQSSNYDLRDSYMPYISTTSVSLSNNNSCYGDQRREEESSGQRMVLNMHQVPVRIQQSQEPVARTRRRKNQQKRTVCHLAEENLSSDMWAWRKYGQKPIKGSPYPRNYYRCSSSKGCPARKQVERSNPDPNIFVVTYTGDHTHPRPTHRNSLAGITRNKLSSTTQKTRTDNNNEAVSFSSDLAATTSSFHEIENQETTKMDSDMDSIELLVDEDPEDDEDRDFLIPNLFLNLHGTIDDFSSWSNPGNSTTSGPDFGDGR